MSLFADSIPELKISLDFQQLKALERNILEPLVDQYLVDMPIPFHLIIVKVNSICNHPLENSNLRISNI